MPDISELNRFQVEAILALAEANGIQRYARSALQIGWYELNNDLKRIQQVTGLDPTYPEDLMQLHAEVVKRKGGLSIEQHFGRGKQAAPKGTAKRP